MANDPLRSKDHALWRKRLLDLCVDRELLALEAQRTGFLDDEAVKHEIGVQSAALLYAAIYDRVLLPQIMPSATEIDTARAGGLFRRAKMAYILSVTDRKATFEIFEAMKHGASFDSIAALYSVHPSASKGGEVGWRRVGLMNAQSWSAFKVAKPGDILGPYSNGVSHEFYRIETMVDPDDKEIREVLMHDRLPEVDSRYRVGLLQKHHFKLDPDQVSSAIFASATEKADSILASLDSGGRRPRRGVRPSLGVLARVDGDSVTYRDIVFPELLRRNDEGKATIEETKDLLFVCSQAILPRLIDRDARQRGIDRDPEVARRLRLIREEVSTRAMVAHAVPAPDLSQSRAFFDAHASWYKRPAARRAFVTMFGSADTARMARPGWDRDQFRDSIFAAQGFRRFENGTTSSLYPRYYGEISILETDPSPLSAAVRSLGDGEISPPIETINGYAIAKALRREEPRAYSFAEVERDVRADAREHAEDVWVTSQLERLRAATPARTLPARLDALRLGMSSETGGNRR